MCKTVLAPALLAVAAASSACDESAFRAHATGTTHDAPAVAAQAAPLSGDPREFVQRLDIDLRKLWVDASRAQWIDETFITDDTDALAARAEEANMEYLGRAMRAATRYQGVKVADDVARQLLLLRYSTVQPAPTDPKERAELAQIVVGLQSAYGKGKYCPPRLKGKCLTLDDLENVMGQSRNPTELLDAWTGWHAIAPPLKAKYERFVELANKGAREVGFKDVGELWRGAYDMPPDAFEAETDRLWNEVRPLYEQLHCYVRSRLRAKYKAVAIGEHDPIPAHLLGNMWAQDWAEIYPLVEPFSGKGSLDVTKKLKEKKVDEIQMVKIGERFFTSLGLDPLPPTFWQRSLFKRPHDRDVVCHASAWDVAYDDDLRIKMCIQPKEDDLVTIHHELGHDYYFHYYHTLPMLFQQGANDGFHEGIGDTIALSVTPGYLHSIGLLDKVPDDAKAELNVLMKLALSKVAFLPFGKLIDQWRWDVFAGKTTPAEYNDAWWTLRQKYQGVAPPVKRAPEDFDPGAKFHVASNTPYMRYFLASIYEFQFHRALCKVAGQTGPLYRCSIYGSKAAGDRLKAMLAMGASRPWPDALEALSGERKADASAILEYFEPLRKWLEEQNRGATCGW